LPYGAPPGRRRRRSPRKGAPRRPTRDTNLRAYIELLRSDLRTQKVAIITEVMAFTEDEDAKFWPIYREYETELAKINDDRIKGIKEYADNFDKITDELADRLVRGRSVSKSGGTRSRYSLRALKSALSPKPRRGSSRSKTRFSCSSISRSRRHCRSSSDRPGDSHANAIPTRLDRHGPDRRRRQRFPLRGSREAALRPGGRRAPS
jgi:hypothetical protein